MPNVLSPLGSANVGRLPYRVVEVIPFQFYCILSLLTRDGTPYGGAAMEHGREFDHPLQTHFRLVFSSVDSPDMPPLPEAKLHPSASACTFTDFLAI